MGKSVADLELSVRSRKALQRLNINSLAELSSRTEDELLGCKNFAPDQLERNQAAADDVWDGPFGSWKSDRNC